MLQWRSAQRKLNLKLFNRGSFTACPAFRRPIVLSLRKHWPFVMTVKGLCRWCGADYWGTVGQARCGACASLAWHYYLRVRVHPPVPVTSSWDTQRKCHLSWLQFMLMQPEMKCVSPQSIAASSPGVILFFSVCTWKSVTCRWIEVSMWTSSSR